tara:strand:- start:472 stop:1260 length:789 start_codon:yes stop_codon:yes gene_type:complete
MFSFSNMPSLTDLLNPTFFLLLAILLLCSALTFVYFESKMREQNHKINSMLSLISTLAEDMNGVKLGLNHLAMAKFNQMNEGEGQPLEKFTHTVELNGGSQLIEVSDDDSDDGTDDSDSDDDDDDDVDDDDDESDSEDYDHPEIKVLKIDTLSAVFDIDDHIKTDSNDQIVELNDDEIVADDTTSVDAQIPSEDLTVADEPSLEIKYMNLADKTVSSEGPSKNYKKMTLAELKTTALSQGLILEDGAKLKKQEILDLLFEPK